MRMDGRQEFKGKVRVNTIKVHYKKLSGKILKY